MWPQKSFLWPISTSTSSPCDPIWFPTFFSTFGHQAFSVDSTAPALLRLHQEPDEHPEYHLDLPHMLALFLVVPRLLLHIATLSSSHRVIAELRRGRTNPDNPTASST